MNNPYVYVGDELSLFSSAVHWKSYFSSKVSKFIQGDVLEVGAGIGSVLRVLYSSEYVSWTCLEPAADNIRNLETLVSGEGRFGNVRVLQGTTYDLDPTDLYDTILYIDVLEHIQKDKDELLRVQDHLRDGGKLVILAPALHSLYSEFDKSIGHYRRYDKKGLRKILPAQLHIVAMFYLDSLGMLLSLANRFLLKNKLPTPGQITFWDNRVIPCSKILDKFLGYRIGKTIVGVFGKEINHA